ncbi:MAG: hypothetical protein KIT69_07260 [Propionibacteriaceae bacterium]|nr:hypothetical protein [Propionibacteriaceae bacterium]
MSSSRFDPAGKRRSRAGWLTLAGLAVLAALGVASFGSGGCASGGECQTAVAGGPSGWLIIVALVALAIVAMRKARRR